MDKKPLNTKPVEEKPKVTRKSDPMWDVEGFEEFYENQLTLSSELKEEIKSQGLDWRFINIASFRKADRKSVV